MAITTRTFSDLDFNFTAHPVTKDISRRFDENAVKSAIKNLVLTSNYERPFHSEIGSPIRRLLFELPTPMFALSLKRAIIDLITNYEPRAEIIDVIVYDLRDENTVNVTIEFKIVNTEKPLSVELVLERTR
jgi:phage baseplate assembly protein W